jgi:hypothetical protein
MRTIRAIALCTLAFSSPGCSDDKPQPWNPAELTALTEEFTHIAEAYAVADVCMPMLDADRDARYRVVSAIEVQRYTQLLNLDTEAELTRFLAHHERRGGTKEQYEIIDRAYRVAYAEAAKGLGSVAICVETVTDYANTILNTNVGSLR